MAITSISKNIVVTTPLTYQMVFKWDSVRNVLQEKYVVATKEISPVQAEKYKHDLFGLLKNELNIPKEFLYPHMIVNGYDSPSNYGGERLRFKILDTRQLKLYHMLFLKN